MSVLIAQRADMCYCPGCSHGVILEQLGRAIDSLGLTPDRVCIVSDIGCIGTADRYFACHTVHGLHGRSVTYAEGIKRMRPDCLVIVLIGDGGCGIGTGHLVHAARRNADIKVIVCNNFNFGMTGGQHSPTTPLDARTSTTPAGAIDYPFDVCQTVAVSGATHVARCNAFDSGIGDQLVQALKTPGFVLVDVWELCTAYFMPANQLDRGGLTRLSEQLGMPFGVLHQKPRPICSAPRQEPRGAERDDPRPMNSVAVPRLAWAERTEICVAGSAGQRIRSAVGVIGEICVAGGLFAAQQDDFPITVRRGFSISNLIVQAKPILYTGVEAPNLLIILSKDGLDRFGDISQLDQSCLLLAPDDLPIGTTRARVHRFDPKAIEKQVGKASVALAVLSFALVHEQLLNGVAVQAAAAAIGGPYAEANLKALSFGSDWAEKTGNTMFTEKRGNEVMS